jgi:hypothetical protein
MAFQLRELVIPVVGERVHGAWAELGSTCRKGGSTCVARDLAVTASGPRSPRRAELEVVRRQIRETVAEESAA